MAEKINRELLMKNPIGPVRITMPAHIAYNIDDFRDSLTNILEELGCRACFSGADCTFQLEREFVVNPAKQITRYATPSRLKRQGSLGRDVLVNVRSPESTYKIDSVFNILDKVFGELGCMACCSGFDITFRTELERVIAPREINI